jgi:hypothetical protein
MTEQEYQAWWQLHVRMARGETLSHEEKARYEAGAKELDAAEKYPSTFERLRTMRARIAELKAEEERLLTEQQALDERIAELEARYYAQTGQSVTTAAE